MHSKSSPQKLNVKQSKNRDLIIRNHTARSQPALILAAVLVSWCAIIFGVHSTQAQTVPPYPVGVWAPYGIGNNDLDPALVNNLGVVGIIVAENWDIVNPAPGVYDWSSVDSRIAQSKAAGFNYISLTIIDSSADTPQWLLDSLPADQKIALLDIAPIHQTFCQFINTALYWNPTFHQARLDLIAAAGAKYTNDPAIVAVNMAAFANHDSNDWNIQDTIGPLVCPSCPQPPPTQCGTLTLDQPSQWLAVGWSEPTMIELGKELCDAAAAAFPNQNIKLPIGGLDITYPAFDGGTYTTMCRGIQDYVYGNASLGIPPRDYASRFFMQRNTVAANWQVGTYFDTYVPGFNADPYIKYMIRAHAHPNPPWTTPGQAGLQMVAAAVLGATTDCRQGGGPDGPCGPTCDPTCVMQTSLDVARTYGTAFIEIWAQDSVEPDFYDMIKATTIAMGGTPRNGLSADLSITVTDTGAVAGASDTYTIVVTNSGPNDVSGVGVADTLPTLLTGETFTATQTGGASGFTASGSGDIDDTVTMPDNSTITYTVTGLIRSSATGTISNTATVTGPAGLNDPSANNSATDTSTITLKADLNVTVTDTGAVAGARDTYTIVVANPGPSDVTVTPVTNTFPANFTGVSFTASQTGGASGYTHSGTGNINDTVTMPANSTITYVANGTIPSSATGTISDTATVTTPNGVNDPNSANNTAIDTSTITLTADLKVTVTDGKSSVVSGQSDTYTIVVTNSGPSNVPGAPVSDNFPAVFTGMSFTATQTGGASGFTASGSGNINDTVTMPSGSVITYTATGTIDPSAPSGTLSDTATVTAPSGVTDPDLTNNSATDSDALVLSANLKVTVTDGKSSVVSGQSDTYTIVVTNNGLGRVTGAVVGDSFPAVFTGVRFTATQTGGASGFTANGSGNINDTVTMPGGSVITYSATGTIDPSAPSGTLSDTATVSVPNGVTDPDLTNNSATDSDTLVLSADLKVTVTDNKGNVVSGQSDTYTIVVTNSGLGRVSGAGVSDSFPAVFTGVTFTATQTGGASGFTASGNGNINDTVTMPGGSVITYTTTGTIDPSAPSGTLSDTATVTAPNGVTDPVLTNNSATDSDTLVLSADLKVTVTDGQTRYTPGASDTYTIVVTNNGLGRVTGAGVSDSFPAFFGGVTFTATQTGGASGFTASGSGNIHDTVTMPGGSVITYIATGTISLSATGTISDTVTVTAPNGVTDPNLTNNSATDSDTHR